MHGILFFYVMYHTLPKELTQKVRARDRSCAPTTNPQQQRTPKKSEKKREIERERKLVWQISLFQLDNSVGIVFNCSLANAFNILIIVIFAGRVFFHCIKCKVRFLWFNVKVLARFCEPKCSSRNNILKLMSMLITSLGLHEWNLWKIDLMCLSVVCITSVLWYSGTHN